MPKRIYKLGEKIYRFSEEDILNGHVGRTLVYLSFPLVLSNIIQVIYNLIDLFWLGKLGTEALAAVAYAWPIVFFFTAIGAGIINAGGVLIAQHRGAKNKEEISYTASQTVTFTVLLSFFLSLFGIITAKPILRLLGASPEIIPLACSYLYIAFSGMILTYGFIISRTFFQNIGDTITPMWITILTFGANIALEPFFIFGWSVFPELGLSGAAAALVTARGIATFIAILLFSRGYKGISIRLSYLLPNFSYLKRLARVGIPLSAEIAIRPLGTNAILPIVSPFGTGVIAAFGIGSRFLDLIFTPAVGISQAIATMAGQNVGADRYHRVVETAKKGVGGTFVIFALIGLITFWQAEFLARIFTTEAHVIKMVAQFLQITAFSFGFLAAIRAFIGIFRGAGNTFLAMMVSLFTFLLFRAPIALLLSRLFEETGVWWAYFFANIAGALVALFWFWKGKWQRRLVSTFAQVSSAE
ncbi:MATE family efflux transporter [Patescibacteria group bacterium]|nr:MATE family efflux transporter [Patescibacteria group bacterium]